MFGEKSDKDKIKEEKKIAKRELKSLVKTLKTFKKIAKSDPDEGCEMAKKIRADIKELKKRDYMKQLEKESAELDKIESGLAFYEQNSKAIREFKEKWGK